MRVFKRIFDLLGASIFLILLSPLFLVVAIAILATSEGPVIYWSSRAGRENRIFRMPKFRSMRVDTPLAPTHLLEDGNRYLTPVGSLLRRTSIDELPQLWSILKGDMSFVGPRPVLFNQDDLNSMRTEAGVHHLRPGLTGWAQINGRDHLSTPEKVAFDREYKERQSMMFDMQIIVLTVGKILSQEGIQH